MKQLIKSMPWQTITRLRLPNPIKQVIQPNQPVYILSGNIAKTATC